MYGVHIAFDNGREPFIRFHMSRPEYCDEMRKFQIGYDLEIENVEEFSTGDSLIFYKACERKAKQFIKNIERMKSRARYFSRTDDRAGKGSGSRSGTTG
jgi:hypothetical protein